MFLQGKYSEPFFGTSVKAHYKLIQVHDWRLSGLAMVAMHAGRNHNGAVTGAACPG